MRTLLLVLVAACFSLAVPAKRDTVVHWLSYTEGLDKASKESKLLFVSVYADWCIPCRIMEKTVYSDPKIVATLNARFIPVKLNAESQDKIKCDGQVKTVERCYFDVWNLTAVPSIVLVAPKGMSILTLSQSVDVDDMQFLLKQFLFKEKEWIAR